MAALWTCHIVRLLGWFWFRICQLSELSGNGSGKFDLFRHVFEIALRFQDRRMAGGRTKELVEDQNACRHRSDEETFGDVGTMTCRSFEAISM